MGNGMSDKVFPAFPYDKVFSREQIADILATSERISAAMRDGVAPNGMTLNAPEQLVQLWAVHMALAGVDVDPERAYIVARRLPDEPGRFQDSQEWVLKEDADKEPVPTADDEAQTYADAIDKQLSPDVRAALIKKLKETG